MLKLCFLTALLLMRPLIIKNTSHERLQTAGREAEVKYKEKAHYMDEIMGAKATRSRGFSFLIPFPASCSDWLR